MARLSGRVAQSAVDALIDLRVGYWLRCQISVRPGFYILTHLRITVLLQPCPARQRYDSTKGKFVPSSSSISKPAIRLLQSYTPWSQLPVIISQAQVTTIFKAFEEDRTTSRNPRPKQ